MATQYTPILQLALPVTGELNGTWGDVVNDNITSMVEEAIAGLATISTWVANSHTLTTADGVTDEARCAMLVATSTTAASNIVCPDRTKLYVLKNASSYAVTLKTSAGTGVAVAAGDTAFLFCDGTNVGSCVTQIVNGHITGNLVVDGTTTLNDTATTETILPAADNTYDLGSSGASWRNLFIDGTATIASLVATTADINGGTIDGTTVGASSASTGRFTQVNITGQGDLRLEDSAGGEYVALQAPATLAASYTLTMPADDGTNGQALITDGSGNLSWSTAASGDVYGPDSATDNAVARFDLTTGKLIQNSGVIIDDSNNVTGVVNLTTSGSVTLSGGTANGVAYLNGSKVLTSGSALTFDGTNLGIGGSATQALTVGNTSALRGQVEIISPAGSSPTLTLDYTAQSGGQKYILYGAGSSAGNFAIYNATAAQYRYQITDVGQHFWQVGASEQMRLTSTGLGIGTSSPGVKLDVFGPQLDTNNTGNIFSTDNSTLGANKGGGVLFGGYYTGTTRTAWAAVSGLKNNATDGDFGGYLSFKTRANGGSLSEGMRLDSSGNLGLGVTPSVWYSTIKALQLGNGALWSLASGNNTTVGSNVYVEASAAGSVYLTTGYATRYQQLDGAHRWYTAPSGTAGNAISFTQAMTLDASGNLGIGTTSPSTMVAGNGVNGIVVGAGSGTTGMTIYSGSSSSGRLFFADGVSGTDPYVGTIQYDHATNSMQFGTNTTERMRIDSSGNLLVGTTSSVATEGGFVWNTGGQIYIGHATGTSSGAYYSGFRYGSDTIGYIAQSGTNAVQYSTTSDYRLKENIQPMQGALERNALLKPVTYSWKADGSTGEGFIAHELQDVCPDAVTGEKDAVDKDGNPVYQGVDTSFLVGHLVACIQELKAELDATKAEVAALKAGA